MATTIETRSTVISEADIGHLASAMRGVIVQPNDPEYDTVRKV